jgi:hypothetical protein
MLQIDPASDQTFAPDHFSRADQLIKMFRGPSPSCPVAKGIANTITQLSRSAASTKRLIADFFQSLFGEQILGVTIAQSEPNIEPNCMSDDVRREGVTSIGDGFHRPP